MAWRKRLSRAAISEECHLPEILEARLNYRSEMGIVTTTKAPTQSCYYCCDVWAGRAQVNLLRYLQVPKSEAPSPELRAEFHPAAYDARPEQRARTAPEARD
jgi:hypothetical protein